MRPVRSDKFGELNDQDRGLAWSHRHPVVACQILLAEIGCGEWLSPYLLSSSSPRRGQCRGRFGSDACFVAGVKVVALIGSLRALVVGDMSRAVQTLSDAVEISAR